MRKSMILVLIATVLLTAAYSQQKDPPAWYAHAAAGIGSGMYGAAGAEYMVSFFPVDLPFAIKTGGKAQLVYSPNSGRDHSLIALGLMPTIRYNLDALPGLELFGGAGFGFISYLKTDTLYKTTIDFYTELGASYSVTPNLAAFAGLGAYWGDLACLMAGIRLGL